MNDLSLHRIGFRYVLVGIGFFFLLFAPVLGNAVIASLVIACLGLVSIFLFVRVISPADEFRFLVALCICSFVLRAFLAFVIHPFAEFFGPDALHYDKAAWSLATDWREGNASIVASGVAGYVFFVGAIYSVFGHTPIGVKIVNGFLATLTVVFVYLIAREIYGKKVARATSLLAAFFPSLILWSALMLKDSLAGFLIIVIIWSTIKLHRQFLTRYVVVLVAGLAYLTQIRSYLVPCIAVIVLSSFILRPGRGAIRNIFTAAILAVIFAAIWKYMPSRRGIISMDLVLVNSVRSGFAVGGSEFLGDVRFNSYTAALKFLPTGLLYFFFGPFPWQVRGVRQMITIPEMTMWYCLMPLMVYGVLYTVRSHAKEAYIIVVYVAVLTLAYIFGITNMGALYRFRAQILVFYLIFAAIGITRLRERSAARRNMSSLAF